MNNNKTILSTLLSASALLAALGCWFCWRCPSRVYGPHALLWRQLSWNAAGIAVFALAWLAGWKRLLKSAPWLMILWVIGFAAAHLCFPAVNGKHRWLFLGPLRLNVITCFMPPFALFVAWLHDRYRLRARVEWIAVAVAVLGLVLMIVCNENKLHRIAGFIWPYERSSALSYMGHQLYAAFSSADWFGNADRDLGFLPCPESDGMMSASALLFGKWFPSAVMLLFAAMGAALTAVWISSGEASKRRFSLLFGLWLTVPAAYCLLHSLGLLPVAGMSPALAGYGGTSVVMAWFGLGVVMSMSDGRPCGQAWPNVAAWGAAAALAVLAVALRTRAGGDRPHFFEPRPSDLTFGEFGLNARRGSILAADGSQLAFTVRAWRIHVDPQAAEAAGFEPKRDIAEIARGLDLDAGLLAAAYSRQDSRYVRLADIDDGTDAGEYLQRNRRMLRRRAGFIVDPVQKRIYPLGASASAAIGFMLDDPQGGGGLEWSCNKALTGVDGVYEERLPVTARYAKASPQPGDDVRTTIVPNIQRDVASSLFDACATNGAESAFALVMAVPSGEIAAMASWPSFDPSMRRDYDKWDSSMAVNRPVQIVFEPGGLVKPLTYAIALDSGAMDEDAKIDQGNGAWEYNGEIFRDETTNSVTIAEAIEKRLNIAAGKTACLVGPEKFHGALMRFGFGARTGMAGLSGEQEGILVSKPECWNMDNTTAMRVGMGYGFAATGLQIAQAYATLANHGTLVRPVLVKTAATNSIVQAMSPASADAIMRMIKSPIPSTVQMCEHDPETGRSVYSPTNYIASCVGFHPVEKPKYVIVVSFTKPRAAHTGEEVAKPVFRSIADSL